jgi:Ser-tRNA(Ala) deacylase AlaX
MCRSKPVFWSLDMQQWVSMTGSIYSYEKDPYRRCLSTEVVEVGETDGRQFAVLSDTVCYPEGGGQPSDRGKLGDVAIVEIERVESVIRHYVDRPIDLGPVDQVLDWERRFDHMQQHTAQHLISSLVLSHLGWETRSFHIGPETSDIEVSVPPPDRGALDSVEEMVAEVIRQAIPIVDRRVSKTEYAELDVRSRGLPATHQGDVRLIEIGGIDVNTCGGTHVRSTSEVEAIKIVRAEPLRGGSRLYWVAGSRLRRRLGILEGRNAELRQLLDTADEELVKSVSSRLGQLSSERRRSRSLEAGFAMAIADRLLDRETPVIDHHLDQSQLGAMRLVAEELRRRAGNQLALLTADDEADGRFAVVAGKRFPGELDEIGNRICVFLEGRGGGRQGIFQGKHKSLRQRSEALTYLESLFTQKETR